MAPNHNFDAILYNSFRCWFVQNEIVVLYNFSIFVSISAGGKVEHSEKCDKYIM